MCGKGGIHIANGPARFDARYRQRVELRQPTDLALQRLSENHEALINRVEISVDYIFVCVADRDEARDFLHRHLVRRWHGKRQEIMVVRGRTKKALVPDADLDKMGTRYDARRGSPNVIVLYGDEHSRVTGEPHCLHLEWRLSGLKAVRRARIGSGQDLVMFNHRHFWEKRLLLFDVDRERLGRLIRNSLDGTRRRKSGLERIGGSLINFDKRTGDVNVRAHWTIQGLIDELPRSYRVRRALIRISNQELLPD
jgi:hypothetical protein